MRCGVTIELASEDSHGITDLCRSLYRGVEGLVFCLMEGDLLRRASRTSAGAGDLQRDICNDFASLSSSSTREEHHTDAGRGCGSTLIRALTRSVGGALIP